MSIARTQYSIVIVVVVIIPRSGKRCDTTRQLFGGGGSSVPEWNKTGPIHPCFHARFQSSSASSSSCCLSLRHAATLDILSSPRPAVRNAARLSNTPWALVSRSKEKEGRAEPSAHTGFDKAVSPKKKKRKQLQRTAPSRLVLRQGEKKKGGKVRCGAFR